MRPVKNSRQNACLELRKFFNFGENYPFIESLTDQEPIGGTGSLLLWERRNPMCQSLWPSILSLNFEGPPDLHDMLDASRVQVGLLEIDAFGHKYPKSVCSNTNGTRQ